MTEPNVPESDKQLPSDVPAEIQGQETEPTASDNAGPDAPVENATTAESPEPVSEEPKKTKDPALLEERLERMRRKQDRSGKVPQISQEAGFLPEVPGQVLDDDLERELQEAMGGMSSMDLFGESQPKRKAGSDVPGTRKKGKVISVHGPDVFLEIPGNRSEGLLPITQFPEGKPEIGTIVEVDVERYDSANGLLILTRKGAAVEADWSTVAAGMTVEARVVETNKGGLTVDVNGIRGFLPISQIALYRVENLEQFVNERWLCKVTEADSEEKNLVVSRRALLEQEREQEREQIWQQLQEGQIRDGVVRKVDHFGAFVDIGGVDGLLHISEMSWVRVKDAREVVQPGQHIKVIVLRIDHDRRKIGLGLKQLEASPWDDVDRRYPVGSVTKGKVTKLAEFGCFVELEPAVEGLVHISECAPQRIRRVAEVVQIDQEVTVKVLDIDKESRRISLSIKAAMKEDAPEEEDVQSAEASGSVEPEEAPKPRKRPENLRGGIGGGKGGGLFQLKSDSESK